MLSGTRARLVLVAVVLCAGCGPRRGAPDRQPTENEGKAQATSSPRPDWHAAVDDFTKRGKYDLLWPDEFLKATEKLKAALREKATLPVPNRDNYGSDFAKWYCDLIAYNNNVISALTMLAEFRDPQDLPLLWKNLVRRKMHQRLRMGSAWDQPVADLIPEYGTSARDFIVRQIAEGKTDNWETKGLGRYYLSAVLNRLCRLPGVGSPEDFLKKEAQKLPTEEKKRVLGFVEKISWKVKKPETKR